MVHAGARPLARPNRGHTAFLRHSFFLPVPTLPASLRRFLPRTARIRHPTCTRQCRRLPRRRRSARGRRKPSTWQRVRRGNIVCRLPSLCSHVSAAGGQKCALLVGRVGVPSLPPQGPPNHPLGAAPQPLHKQRTTINQDCNQQRTRPLLMRHRVTIMHAWRKWKKLRGSKRTPTAPLCFHHLDHLFRKHQF